MYKFVDTNEVSESALLPSEALQINGEFIENLIPGYRTLNVSGREALSPEISTFETGARDGSMFKSKRYPARTIIVKYHLIAESCEAFRAAFNDLASILNVKDAELIFNDEKDKYFIGTPSAIGEVEPGMTAVVGEFEILCLDPFKYSTIEYEAEAVESEDGGKMFVVNYNGTYKSFPKFEIEFFKENEVSDDGATETPLTGNGDCGFVAFFNEDEKIIQLGDPEEVDGEEYDRAQRLVSQNFYSANVWGDVIKKIWMVNKGITSSETVVQTGSLKEIKTPIFYANKNSEWYLTAENYGTGTKWHGPSITRIIPADGAGEAGASNFLFSYTQKMSIGSGNNAQQERGAFQVLLVNGSGSSRKIVAGVNVYKSSSGNKANLRFYVNGKTVKTLEIDLSYHNKYFGNNRAKSEKKSEIVTAKTSRIQKSGSTVIFNIGGYEILEYVCTDIGFENMKVNQITFTFSQYGSMTPLSYNGLAYTYFVKYDCDTWKEVSNKFGANDVLLADCRNAEILLNNMSAPELGALGNDWEKFYLKPGLNQIGIAYSEWLTGKYVPDFKLRYREVFL